ncbi:hypothetical protein ACLOJK_003493 [Asimina triloba]
MAADDVADEEGAPNGVHCWSTVTWCSIFLTAVGVNVLRSAPIPDLIRSEDSVRRPLSDARLLRRRREVTAGDKGASCSLLPHRWRSSNGRSTLNGSVSLFRSRGCRSRTMTVLFVFFSSGGSDGGVSSKWLQSVASWFLRWALMQIWQMNCGQMAMGFR